MPVQGGVGGAAARRAEAKRLASESAELAHVSMKVANSALEELRELREPGMVGTTTMKKTKKKKSGVGLEARPTSSSAARAAETTAVLDVKNEAKVKFERAKRRIMGRHRHDEYNDSAALRRKPPVRHPRPPSAPSTSLGTSGPHVRCDACHDGRIMRDAEVAWARERAALMREISAHAKRKARFSLRFIFDHLCH